MNLLLLEREEVVEGRTLLKDRRMLHAQEILKVAAGDTLKVGIIGGEQGIATVERMDADGLALHLQLLRPPPCRPGLDLLLAMPRPKALKRLFPVIAQLGIDRVVLLNAARVERSYFASPALENETIRRLLLEGLEQVRDTILPEVVVRERFRPFVEDEVPLWYTKYRKLLAHPSSAGVLEREQVPTVVAVGPEGGWVPFEVGMWEKAGFQGFSLGERILRTETLVPYLAGALR